VLTVTGVSLPVMATIALSDLSIQHDSLTLPNSPTNDITAREPHRNVNTDYADEVLELVQILFALNVPVFSPSTIDANTAASTHDSLGKGGQYVVDRVYDNQRFVIRQM
jgi:hypothetical protein